VEHIVLKLKHIRMSSYNGLSDKYSDDENLLTKTSSTFALQTDCVICDCRCWNWVILGLQ